MPAKDSYRREFSRRGVDLDLALGGKPCAVAERFEDVLAFEIRVQLQERLDALSGGEVAEDHADRHPHAADARLTAHDVGMAGDARKVAGNHDLPSLVLCFAGVLPDNLK